MPVRDDRSGRRGHAGAVRQQPGRPPSSRRPILLPVAWLDALPVATAAPRPGGAGRPRRSRALPTSPRRPWSSRRDPAADPRRNPRRDARRSRRRGFRRATSVVLGQSRCPAPSCSSGPAASAGRTPGPPPPPCAACSREGAVGVGSARSVRDQHLPRRRLARRLGRGPRRRRARRLPHPGRRHRPTPVPPRRARWDATAGWPRPRRGTPGPGLLGDTLGAAGVASRRRRPWRRARPRGSPTAGSARRGPGCPPVPHGAVGPGPVARPPSPGR